VPSEATPSSCAMTGWISDIVALNEPAGANNSLAEARDQGEPKTRIKQHMSRMSSGRPTPITARP